jgi:hypothetical protein
VLARTGKYARRAGVVLKPADAAGRKPRGAHFPREVGESPTLPSGGTARDLNPVILFALEMAMRPEGVASLAWPEIDLKKRTA